MFNSTLSQIVKVSFAAAVLMGASVSAHADSLIPTDLTSNIEQNISAQMQDMMQVAQRELSLSLQAQLSEAMFEVHAEDKTQLAEEKNDQVITSAMIKD